MKRLKGTMGDWASWAPKGTADNRSSHKWDAGLQICFSKGLTEALTNPENHTLLSTV